MQVIKTLSEGVICFSGDNPIKFYSSLLHTCPVPHTLNYIYYVHLPLQSNVNSNIIHVHVYSTCMSYSVHIIQCAYKRVLLLYEH